MNGCQSDSSLGRAERVALCALRRALHGEADECAALVCPFGLGRDFIEVRRLFADVWKGGAVPSILLNLSVWGVTKTEHRLLRGLAAAQAENELLLDHDLQYFIGARAVRRRFAVAMEALAATLAVHGYWLPQQADLLMIPASVLMLARAQGHDLRQARIAWP